MILIPIHNALMSKKNKKNKNRKTPHRNYQARSFEVLKNKFPVIIGTISLIFIAFLSLGYSMLVGVDAVYKSKYHTLAHQFLDLEKQSGFKVTVRQYQFLDNLIDQSIIDLIMLFGKSESTIDKAIQFFNQKTYTRAEALLILGKIDDVLTKNNFLHKPSYLISLSLKGSELDDDLKNILRGNIDKMLFVMPPDEIDISGFVKDHSREKFLRTFIKENNAKINYISKHLDEEYHYTDCHNTVALYLSIGEVLGLPLYSVNIPNHTFIRFYTGKNEYLDWEVTKGGGSNDDNYSRLSGISLNDPVVKNGVYFRNLDRDENFGTRYLIMGNIMLNAGKFSTKQKSRRQYYLKALDHFETALKFNPRFKVIHNNTGFTFEALGDAEIEDGNLEPALRYYQNAKKSFGEAHAVFPNNKEFLKQVNALNIKIGKYQGKAI